MTTLVNGGWRKKGKKKKRKKRSRAARSKGVGWGAVEPGGKGGRGREG